MIVEACARIAEFCRDHYKPSINGRTNGSTNSIEEMTNNFAKILEE